MFFCCGITDRGAVRPQNEDAFLINRIVMTKAAMESSLTAPFIIGAADGAAGENTGEIASTLCLELLSNIKYSSRTNLKEKFLSIHKNLREYGISHENSLNMQTTLCALGVDENGRIISANCGDSRLYLFSSGKLSQLTKDQSLIELLIDAGEITREESHSHNQKHVIFPVLGNVDALPIPDIREIPVLRENELLLLCTDGIPDALSEVEIVSVLNKKKPLRSRLEELVTLAKSKNCADNITIVALSNDEI